MSMLTQAMLNQALAQGATASLIDYALPSKMGGGEGEPKTKRSFKGSLKIGGYMTASSLINNGWMVSQYVPNGIPLVTKQVAGTAVVFTGLRALASKNQRSGKRVLTNLLLAAGSGYVADKWVAPMVMPMMPGATSVVPNASGPILASVNPQNYGTQPGLGPV